MKTTDFDYFLPPKLIAEVPAEPRDLSRLLVFNSKTKRIYHRHFFDLSEFVRAGDLLIINNSKVMPARLFGRKVNGGKIEILLLNQTEDFWRVLIGGKTKVGDKIDFSKKLSAEVFEKSGKEAEIKFNLSNADFWSEIEKNGRVPIPPYIIKKLKTQNSKVKSSESYFRKHYQTVYAKKFGSAAAPTAGLHFSQKIINNLKSTGIDFAEIDLHVGLGTFAPITDAEIENKKLHSEYFEISQATVDKILKTKKSGGRIFAVGTTSVRALESAATEILAGKKVSSSTEIFIQPGDKFRIVDGLVTNFHLPKSSLMMLVAAFLEAKGIFSGRGKLLELYKIAIKKQYRFYSFGDAMLIF